MNELRQFAKFFIGEGVKRLKKDVDHCLQEPLATFPAIQYCFSAIESMGGIVEGEASIPPRSKTYINPCNGNTEWIGANGAMANYLRHYMSYTDEQTCLLLQIFRHKLAHMGQPRPVLERGGKKIAWRYEHDNTARHLLLEPVPVGTKITVKTGWEIQVDEVFSIGIRQLVNDLEESIYRHGGYFDKFETDTSLQDNFEKAIQGFYSPT